MIAQTRISYLVYFEVRYIRNQTTHFEGCQ